MASSLEISAPKPSVFYCYFNA